VSRADKCEIDELEESRRHSIDCRFAKKSTGSSEAWTFSEILSILKQALPAMEWAPRQVEGFSDFLVGEDGPVTANVRRSLSTPGEIGVTIHDKRE
jgi:hypothetical protein